jgi:predicted small metal-binding protein
MAKKFACKNIGLACAFETTAENEEALLAQVREHAKTAHNMEQVDEVTMSKIKASFQEA